MIYNRDITRIFKIDNDANANSTGTNRNADVKLKEKVNGTPCDKIKTCLHFQFFMKTYENS